MIRRDYFLRLVQEMAQVLARVISLRRREEYDQALKEIDAALRGLSEGGSTPKDLQSVEDWIGLCRKHEQAASGLLIGVGDLLREQGELLLLRGDLEGAHRGSSLALGLLLEGLLTGETFVSAGLLDKVEGLAGRLESTLTDDGVWRRLVRYHEARGRYAQAENVLFRWRERHAGPAIEEGLAFYDRLSGKDDAELERGNLPRQELGQGRSELMATIPGGIHSAGEGAVPS